MIEKKIPFLCIMENKESAFTCIFKFIDFNVFFFFDSFCVNDE